MSFTIHLKKPHTKCLFLDSGHSARDFDGDYITKEQLNAKYYQHSSGEFHGGGMFEEGTKNQEYCLRITEAALKKGIQVIPTSHSYKDTPLDSRVAVANYYHKNIQAGIFFSEHSNAYNSTARGFCMFTSPGTTPSDALATKFIQMYGNKYLNGDLASHNKLGLRKEMSDGDPDYEARFTVLVKTNMPAVLSENLFFDNFLDASILEEEWYKDTYAELVADWADWACK